MGTTVVMARWTVFMHAIVTVLLFIICVVLAVFLVLEEHEDDIEAVATVTVCNPATTNLLDFRQWREECDPESILTDANGVKKSHAFWWGKYTLLDADGNPSTSASWPYPYDHYYGFIRMKVVGNTLYQRNVFVYPPATNATCNASENQVAANLTGTCGVNGAEKVFEAEQSATDCQGNLAGPFGTGLELSDTYTTLVGNGTAILYQVKTPDYATLGLPQYAFASNNFVQSQLTTLPGNGARVRTAQGFNPFSEATSYASYYREYRSANETLWLVKLQEIRAQLNILPADMCKHAGGGAGVLSAPNCYTHFLLDDDFNTQLSCVAMNGGDPQNRCA